MDERRLELRVAFLALAAIASGAGLLYLIGAFESGGDAKLAIVMEHTGGVPAGAAVKVAGVQVGRVRAIRLDPERRDDHGAALPVTLDVTLDHAVLAKLHAGARAGVATQGPLGEPFLEIDPGPAVGPVLADGATLRADDPPRLDLLLARMERLVDNVDTMLGDAADGGLVHDAATLTRDADGMLRDNREAIAATLRDVHEAVADLRTVAAQSKALLADGKVKSMLDDASAVATNLRENVPPLTQKANALADSAQNVAGHFTPEDGAKLKEAMAHAEEASARLDAIATRADKLLADIDAGKGNAGGMLKDDQLYKDLKDLVADLKAHPWKVLWK